MLICANIYLSPAVPFKWFCCDAFSLWWCCGQMERFIMEWQCHPCICSKSNKMVSLIHPKLMFPWITNGIGHVHTDWHIYVYMHLQDTLPCICSCWCAHVYLSIVYTISYHPSLDEQLLWLHRWFAKRFLHPDIVAEYNYIFLWDEDLGVENFNPRR